MTFKIGMHASAHNRRDLFEAEGFEVVEAPVATIEESIELLKDVDGALIGGRLLTNRKVLEACPTLKIVSRLGVGVDSIDLDAATELGILACNVPGVNTAEVADHAVAMLLSLTRQLFDSIVSVRNGEWSENPSAVTEFQQSVRRIGGHTVGIVGLGNIGRAFATRIRGFGPKEIIACDPYVEQSTADLYGVTLVDLETLVKTSDYISIHASWTQETEHLFNEEIFSLMKPSALLVNCARGQLVEQKALLTALKSGQIQAAAIDVTEKEPIEIENPLLDLPNLIITPHTAGYSPTFLEECSRKQAESVINVLSGKAPHGLANPEVIKTIAVMRAGDAGRWAGIPDFSTALPL